MRLFSFALVVVAFVFAAHTLRAQERLVPAATGATVSAVVPFTSNGCSGFREATFFTCCFMHDFSFWAGGNWTARRAADKTLRRCVLDISGEYVIADISYLLLRLGVVPGYVGVNDGWARAWAGTRRARFEPLTPSERQVVDEERQRVCRTLVVNPDTNNFVIDARYLSTERRELRARQARQFCGNDLFPR
jgi:hypothetical protein